MSKTNRCPICGRASRDLEAHYDQAHGDLDGGGVESAYSERKRPTADVTDDGASPPSER